MMWRYVRSQRYFLSSLNIGNGISKLTVALNQGRHQSTWVDKYSLFRRRLLPILPSAVEGNSRVDICKTSNWKISSLVTRNVSTNREAFHRRHQIAINKIRAYSSNPPEAEGSELTSQETTADTVDSKNDLFDYINDEELENIPFDLDYEEYIGQKDELTPHKKVKKKRRRSKREQTDLKNVIQSLSLNVIDAGTYLSIEEVVEFLKENNALDLCVIKVSEARFSVKYVDYFVVVTGRSTRHLRALAYGLTKKFKAAVREKGGKITAVVEGEDCLDWMVVDINSAVVHFMLPEIRETYELEKLWSLGQKYDDQYQQMVQEVEEAPLTIEEIEKRFESEARNESHRSLGMG